MPDVIPQRRTITFEDLSKVMSDVRRLKTSHRTLARWSLAQSCKHLANSFNGSIEGFSLKRHRFKRRLIRGFLLRFTLRFGIPPDYRVDPSIEPTEDLPLETAIDQLAQSIERFQNHQGPLQAHPLFGVMDHEMWSRIHCIHCAHHLSFVLPDQT